MLSKKLISLLQTFSKQDLNQFRKFIHSPYYNENQELIQLFQLINDQLNNSFSKLANISLEKRIIWKKIFGKINYQDTKMRRLSSDLNKLAEQFLILKKLEKEPLKKQIILLQTTNAPPLAKHFTNTLNLTQKAQKKLGFQNASFHYNAYLIEKEQHINAERTEVKTYRMKHLEQADYHLDCYYMIQKLKHYCDVLGYANFREIHAHIQLPPSFLEYIYQSDYIKDVGVYTYYLIAQMFLYPENESYFQQLKKTLKNKGNLFPKTELNTLYIHLKNYCIHKKINIGQSSFFLELFDIFKTLLEQEIIIENGIILPQPYKNIITVGLHVQAFEWVENFIQTYTQKLPPENQENALNYNLAKVYFHQKQYEKVIDQLREVEYKSLIYALGGKLMLLKTYYELKEDRALESLIDSFRIYLRRNKLISKDVQQQYLNVLRFVKKMANVAPYDKEAIEKIRLQIDNCKALADKKWIVEKINEF